MNPSVSEHVSASDSICESIWARVLRAPADTGVYGRSRAAVLTADEVAISEAASTDPVANRAVFMKCVTDFSVVLSEIRI